MDLQAGRHRVAIAYHPRTLAPALGMTLAGIGLSIVLCRRSRTEVRRAATPRILSPAVLAATGVVLAYLVVLGAVT
jgi:uncharacterized membrane protein